MVIFVCRMEAGAGLGVGVGVELDAQEELGKRYIRYKFQFSAHAASN